MLQAIIIEKSPPHENFSEEIPTRGACVDKPAQIFNELQ